MFGPVRMIGRFFFSAILVLSGLSCHFATVRRAIDRLYLPAKNKILFVLQSFCHPLNYRGSLGLFSLHQHPPF